MENLGICVRKVFLSPVILLSSLFLVILDLSVVLLIF
jgi:hypothetical protein